jgi:hypothetical protein
MRETSNDTVTLPATQTSAAAGLTAHITINNHPAPAKSPAAPAKLPSGRVGLPTPSAKPALPIADTIGAAQEVTRETKDDAITGARSTIYRDAKGTEAILTEDPKDHNKVRLHIVHKSGDTLTVQGDRRGFDATVNGKPQKADAWRIVGFDDVVHCAGKKEDVDVNQAESVTRDKLQQFAKENPQLAAALRGVDLPVTVAGGYPVNFDQAVKKPTHYRACPVNNAGIVVERLQPAK